MSAPGVGLLQSTVAALQALGPAPALAVVLGSGWDAACAAVQGAVELPYAELPAFPRPSVQGHAGRLLHGELAGVPVALLRGRSHLYEHGDAAAMAGAVRSLAAWGCRALVLTNAAGGLAPALGPGSFMLLTDHLNLVQCTPLEGEAGAGRFVDMVDAYDPALRAAARAAAERAGLALAEGVYAFLRGPQFETPAEIRMLRTLGADAVGMSTVPECILARHAGLKVLGLSMVTNHAAGLGAQGLSHAQTLQAAAEAGPRAAALLRALMPALALALAPPPTSTASSPR